MRGCFRKEKKEGKPQKIGHTGTLDPQAEGVLPVCMGRATKLTNYLMSKSKTYQAELILGMTTDTGDHTGKVLTTKTVNTTAADVKDAASSFAGGYMQVPPMYSAIKIDGKRLYQLARAGKSVDRKARFAEIFRIDIINEDLKNNRVWLEIDCGKGTYIRTLCEDIGEKLGCGGCMGDLTRTRSGIFTVQNSLPVSEFKDNTEKIIDFLVPADEAFPAPKGFVTDLKMAVNGHSLRPGNVDIEMLENDSLCWLYYGETIIGLYRLQAGMFKPEVMMYEN